MNQDQLMQQAENQWLDGLNDAHWEIEKLEHLVTTSEKESVLSWVFDNLDYSIYEHLCFITGDAD